jgi:hypothetical protein
MPTTPLENLNSALKAQCDEAETLYQTIDGEAAPTEEQLKKWNERLGELKTSIPALKDQIKAAEAETAFRVGLKNELARIAQPANGMQFDNGEPAKQPPALKALAKGFVEGAAYKTWIEQVGGTSKNIPTSSAHGRLPASAPFDLGSLKTIITGQSAWAAPGDTSGAALTQPQFLGVRGEGVWMAPLTVIDMVTHVPAESDILFYVRVTAVSLAAAVTAEATSASDSSGEKPEGGMTFEQAEAIVRTIPVWTPVTRQAIAQSTQVQDRIERYMRYAVRSALNTEIIAGSGSGQHFTGIQNLTNKLTQAFSTDLLTTARKARTHLLLAGRTIPNAWCFHPNDWETFDLQQDNEARYFFGGPLAMGTPTLWGVPVLQDEAVTAGHCILADFTRYVVADREQTTIRISDSHSDFFVRNLLAILAECRAAGFSEQDQAFEIVALS